MQTAADIKSNTTIGFMHDGQLIFGIVIGSLGRDYIVRPKDQWNYPGDYVVAQDEIHIISSLDERHKKPDWLRFLRVFFSF